MQLRTVVSSRHTKFTSQMLLTDYEASSGWEDDGRRLASRNRTAFSEQQIHLLEKGNR